MPRRRGVEAQHPMQAKALASQVCRDLPTTGALSSRCAPWGARLTTDGLVPFTVGSVEPRGSIACEGE